VGNIQSNSGNPLKLLVPSLYLNKNISGFNYFKDSVTIQKTLETIMGDRGSKLDTPLIRSFSIKEQREDDSRYLENKYLRSSLMGSESRYLINYLSKQFKNKIRKASFSTSIVKSNLSLTKLDP
jgi:hypothetical protein